MELKKGESNESLEEDEHDKEVNKRNRGHQSDMAGLKLTSSLYLKH